MTAIEGLVEKLAAIHRPSWCWNGSGEPSFDRCCASEWPCPTVRAIHEALGADPPEPQITSRWVDGPGFWKGGIEVVHGVWPEKVSQIEAEMVTWTDAQRERYNAVLVNSMRKRWGR